METVLTMNKVAKRYGKRTALRGLNIRVPAGSLFGLVGSNGAGKTTALSIAAGITRADSGTVDVFGNGPFEPARSAGRLSLSPRAAVAPPHARVRDLLFFYAGLQGLSAGRSFQAADEALEQVHLADRAESSIRSLSHGMRRRVAVAQAFLGDIELALLDEPMSGLDPREVMNLREMLSNRRNGRTIVISSHNLFEIERICDEVAFIESGQTVRQDSLEQVTGRTHALTYFLEPETVRLKDIQQILPGARFSVAPANSKNSARIKGCRSVLLCEYDGNAMTAGEVNKAVLPGLIKAGIQLIEVRRGMELEHAYLAVSGESQKLQDLP